MLIGLEMLLVKFNLLSIEAALLIIPLVILGRFISVGSPIAIMRLQRRYFLPYTVRMMVWGGLRGGISIALALSLEPGAERDLILTMTYGVVVFALLGQGLTVDRMAKRVPTQTIES